MKHACGKVFDPNLAVQLRKGNKARIICLDRLSLNDDDNIGALHIEKSQYEKSAWEQFHSYFKCGHRYSDHDDYPEDLVNVLEQKEKNKIDLTQARKYFDILVHRINNSEIGPTVGIFIVPLVDTISVVMDELEKLS